MVLVNGSREIPRVMSLETEEGNEAISTLSSNTTRSIYQHICGSRLTPADIAELEDMTTQNVHYHLRKLRETGLIHSVGVKKSQKGVEMQIYETTTRIVICDDDELAVHFTDSTRVRAGIGCRTR